MSIYPFRVYATSTDTPKLARMLWQRSKEFRHWYAADYSVLSDNEVKLRVYSMEDPVYGGVGPLIHEEVFTEFTDAERTLLNEEILKQQTMAAEREFERRERREREHQILRIRRELFGI